MRQRGFTLLELSIVLVLIALIISGGLAIVTSSLQASQYNATVTRMTALDQALLNYSIVNNRIPCPADLTIASYNTTTGTYYNSTVGADYGMEAGSDRKSAIGVGTGVCSGTNMTPKANFVSTSGAAEGGVPTRALNLPDDYMYDGWGKRFRYAVDPIYTVKNSLPSPAGGLCSASPSAITANDFAGAARTTAGIYALISHGANGHGAYTSDGAVSNTASYNPNELINCHCDNSATATTYTPQYVQQVPTNDPNDALDSFDDIVTFKEGWQMQAPNFPLSTAIKCTSSIYIADSNNSRVRKVDTSGTITTAAGNGGYGYSGDGGPATAAQLYEPAGVAVDSSGNFYIADYWNNCIRKVNSAGTITTVAGNGTGGYTGDGGPATSAELNRPDAVAVDSSGNIYIADTYNFRIRKVNNSGTITTVAGNGSYGSGGDGGPATSASFIWPPGVAVDSSGNFYIPDSHNEVIRKVNGSGIISTFAGNGTGGYTGDNGPAASAELNFPNGVAVDSSGNLYIADSSNNVIRKVSVSGTITTVAGNGTAGYTGDGGPATSAELSFPNSVSVDSSGNIYISDNSNNVIRKVNSSGTITTVAGNGGSGYSGDGGPATSATINDATGVAR